MRAGVAAAVVAAAAAAAGGAAALLRRRSARAAARPPDGAAGRTETAAQEWRCDCGARFRVAGIDRHRVFWPHEAPESDPVLSGRCPSCDRPLPADHAAPTA